MTGLDRRQNDGVSTQASEPMRNRDAAEWVRLNHAVNELARRYPRTYGTTIPATWQDDPDTVELLACITAWRHELDEHEHAPPDEHETPDPDTPRPPSSRLQRSQQEWEWHSHRDQWLTRLAETGRSPLPTAAE